MHSQLTSKTLFGIKVEDTPPSGKVDLHILMLLFHLETHNHVLQCPLWIQIEGEPTNWKALLHKDKAALKAMFPHECPSILIALRHDELSTPI